MVNFDLWDWLKSHYKHVFRESITDRNLFDAQVTNIRYGFEILWMVLIIPYLILIPPYYSLWIATVEGARSWNVGRGTYSRENEVVEKDCYLVSEKRERVR